MAYSNGIITRPVSISDVRTALGESTNDLGSLCTSNNINMWARYKPVRDTGDTGGTAVPSKPTPIQSEQNPADVALRWGLHGLYYSGGANGVIIFDNNNKLTHGSDWLWEYRKPRGAEVTSGADIHPNEFYRLSDFENYNHNAPCPINIIFPMDIPVSTGARIAATLAFENGANTGLWGDGSTCLHLSDLGLAFTNYYPTLGLLHYGSPNKFYFASADKTVEEFISNNPGVKAMQVFIDVSHFTSTVLTYLLDDTKWQAVMFLTQLKQETGTSSITGLVHSLMHTDDLVVDLSDSDYYNGCDRKVLKIVQNTWLSTTGIRATVKIKRISPIHWRVESVKLEVQKPSSVTLGLNVKFTILGPLYKGDESAAVNKELYDPEGITPSYNNGEINLQANETSKEVDYDTILKLLPSPTDFTFWQYTPDGHTPLPVDQRKAVFYIMLYNNQTSTLLEVTFNCSTAPEDITQTVTYNWNT